MNRSPAYVLLIALLGLTCQRDTKSGSGAVLTTRGDQAQRGSPRGGDSVRYLRASDSIYLRFFEDTARSLLAGYRLPTKSDFRNYWSYYQNKFVYGTEGHDTRPKAPFWTDGLFNADQRRDYAYILIHESTGKKSLVVLLSERGGYRAVPLQEDFDDEMGLATQQPVKLTYYPTADADRKVLDMKREGIAFVMFESAGSVFVWDEATNAFKRYWTSD